MFANSNKKNIIVQPSRSLGKFTQPQVWCEFSGQLLAKNLPQIPTPAPPSAIEPERGQVSIFVGSESSARRHSPFRKESSAESDDFIDPLVCLKEVPSNVCDTPGRTHARGMKVLLRGDRAIKLGKTHFEAIVEQYKEGECGTQWP